MKRPQILILIGILVIAAVIFGIIFIQPKKNNCCQNASSSSSNIQSGTLSASSSPNSSMLQAVYPLYKNGLDWIAEVPLTLDPHADINPTANILVGYELESDPTSTTTDISAITGPFEKYYDDKLTVGGFTANLAFQADGAGSSLSVYQKGNEIVILSYRSAFSVLSTNHPAACPCSITFNIFSGVME